MMTDSLKSLNDAWASSRLNDDVRAFDWLVRCEGASISEALRLYRFVQLYEGRAIDYAHHYACADFDLAVVPSYVVDYFDFATFAASLINSGAIATYIDRDGKPYVITNAADFYHDAAVNTDL